MLKSEQQLVYDWLNNDLDLPVFAEAYKGAATLLHHKPAGHISFVAHAGRDLMNSLATTVNGISAGRVQYQQYVDELQENWLDDWRSDDGLGVEDAEIGHLIPKNICQKITDLIEEHKSGRMRSSDADALFFSTFLDYSDREKIPENFISEWKKTKGWFYRHTHLREKPFKQGTESDLEKHFACLDGYLNIAASSQYDRLKELNEILETTNQ